MFLSASEQYDATRKLAHVHIICQGKIKVIPTIWCDAMFTCFHCNFHSIICKLGDIRIRTVMNPNYVNDRSKFYSKQKTSLHHGPPIVTIKKENRRPPKWKPKEVHTSYCLQGNCFVPFYNVNKLGEQNIICTPLEVRCYLTRRWSPLEYCRA